MTSEVAPATITITTTPIEVSDPSVGQPLPPQAPAGHHHAGNKRQRRGLPPGVKTGLTRLVAITSIFKLAHIVLAFIILICLGSAASDHQFLYFVAATSLVTSLLLELIHLSGVQLFKEPKLLGMLQFFDVIVWTMFYIIFACIASAQAVRSKYDRYSKNGYASAAFFAWIAAIVYGAHTAYLIVQHAVHHVRHGAQSSPAPHAP